jgi:predicted amidohydrolase YtcJ
VILDDHFMTVSAERLRTLQPDMTVIGGRVVFDRAAAR